VTSLKNNPKKNFEHPFESFFKTYFIEDPLVLVLSYIIVIDQGSKSGNLNEFFFFHLFFVHNRLLALPNNEVFDKMDWEIQFLINSFVIVDFSDQAQAPAQVLHLPQPLHPPAAQPAQGSHPLPRRLLPHRALQRGLQNRR